MDTTKKDPMANVKKHVEPQTKNMQPKEMLDKAKETAHKVTGGKGGAQMMGTAAGVVVGAAIGGIAGAAMTDKKTREKLTEFTKNAADAADRLSEKAAQLSEKTSELTDNVSTLQEKTAKTN